MAKVRIVAAIGATRSACWRPSVRGATPIDDERDARASTRDGVVRIVGQTRAVVPPEDSSVTSTAALVSQSSRSRIAVLR